MPTKSQIQFDLNESEFMNNWTVVHHESFKFAGSGAHISQQQIRNRLPDASIHAFVPSLCLRLTLKMPPYILIASMLSCSIVTSFVGAWFFG